MNFDVSFTMCVCVCVNSKLPLCEQEYHIVVLYIIFIIKVLQREREKISKKSEK